MRPTEVPPPTYYRLDKALIGERLVPVASEEEATHVGVAAYREHIAAHQQMLEQQDAALRQMHRQVALLEQQVVAAQVTTEQATAVAARNQQEAAQQRVSVRCLAAKNKELVGEKRRLRDLLMAKLPLPSIYYRIDVDRDDTARESLVFVLDTFPHRDHARAALAEARRIAERCDGRVRQVRLDTAAWRAVILRVIDEDDEQWPTSLSPV